MKYVWIILTTVFFIGCGPKYIIKKQYIPSKNVNFSQCASTCNNQKSLCSQNCQENYQTCLSGEYSRAQDIYANAMNVYDKDYDKYMFNLRKYNTKRYRLEQRYRFLRKDYNYFNIQCDKKHDLYACDRRDSIRDDISNIRMSIRRQPQKPIKPSLYQITNAQQSLCSNNCGCSNNFDVCYSNCGGSVVPYKFCVSNCD